MCHLFTFGTVITIFMWVTTGNFQPASEQACISGLRCFSTEWRHIRRTSLWNPVKIPESREELGVHFHLYSRKKGPFDLGPGDNISAWQETFVPQRRTFFLIHGFMGLVGFQKRAVEESRKILMDIINSNIVVVDWTKASSTPYTKAAIYTQFVGAELALRIRELRSLARNDNLDIHLIGVSMGAHVAGVAGGLLNGTIRRITGLDPAGPLFEKAPLELRLDPSDAVLVDAIHSDPAGVGIKRPVGHMDFYPNYGKRQPGCYQHSTLMKDDFYESIARFFLCSHGRAYEYFAERSDLNDCLFVGHKCQSWEAFEKGECSNCESNCVRMGLAAELDKSSLSPNETAVFYLKTNAISPYCGFQYKVEVLLNETSKPQPDGRFILRLVGENGKVAETSDSSTSDLHIGGTQRNGHVIISRDDLGMVKTAHFAWSQESYNKQDNKSEEASLHVESVLITPMNNMDDQVVMKLCPENQEPIPERNVTQLSREFCTPVE